MRFWDSSAVVPLVIDEATSEQVDRWTREDDEMVVWTLTSVEIVSALRRRVREGSLTEQDAMAAEELAGELLQSAHEVVAIDVAKTFAHRLLRTHPLRAADALQLAAALLWTEGLADGAVLHTFDRRLATAALREGFRPVPFPEPEDGRRRSGGP